MLVSYKWLQEYIEIGDISPQEIAEKMTRSGIEIDFIHERNKGATNVVVGYVAEVAPHPDADKLNVCQVDIGEEERVQIVCGAPNVSSGQYVAVAKVGARLPGGIKIKKAKLRGQHSNGMICSLQELGIDSKLVPKGYVDGIYVFPETQSVEPGQDALALFELNDSVLELDLTPNRSDCMHMLGVAYELAALYDRPIKMPKTKVKEVIESADGYINVSVENGEDTPFYQALVIKDVKIGPSPSWLQNRLMAAGIRPISNVVDVTNYVLLEYGQPLHAFDYHALASKSIHVRRAKAEEAFTTLDGEKRTLSPEQLVVTNGREPVALAGVMGGLHSEVTAATTTVVLEAAAFHPTVVRRSARLAGLRSDSSARFEKGINQERVSEAARRAAYLIQEIAGGIVLSGAAIADARVRSERVIALDLDKMNERIGTNLSIMEVAALMRRLQFPCEKVGSDLHVTVPHRRGDITIPEDLYEEVARLYGYDELPSTLPVGNTTQGKRTAEQAKRRKMEAYLRSAGLSEAISYALTSSEKAALFAAETIKPIQVAMPMSEERSTMRTSLLPHLYDICAYNLNRNNNDVLLYERGSVFLSEQETLTELPTEQERLAVLLSGTYMSHPWQGEKKAVDFYVLKGIAEGLMETLGLSEQIEYKPDVRPGFHPGRTANVLLKGESIGFLAQVHPSAQKALDLNETYVLELNVDALFAAETEALIYRGIPRYPAITRDMALVVSKETTAAELMAIIREAGGELLETVSIFDVYEGEHMESGKKSIAFSLTYRHAERTLTDEEASLAHEGIVAEVQKQTGAVLRA